MYLIKNIEQLDLIVDQVCFLVPASFFYKPDINQEYFLSFRQDLEEMRRRSQSIAYRQDGYIKNNYLRRLRQYNEELDLTALKNREEFVSILKGETDEMKVACLYNLIRYYKLLPHLRTFNR